MSGWKDAAKRLDLLEGFGYRDRSKGEAMIEASRSIRYYSFGYIPTGRLVRDLYRRLTGYPNILKRLQVPDIIKALGVGRGDKVLDLGCGAGYITVELAKIARESVGVDIGPHLKSNVIPPSLAGRLRYIVSDGRAVPVPDGYFDVALCSEVLMMIPDPNEFLREVRRVTSPRARLVVVNGLGHPVIDDAYRTNHWFLRLARHLYKDRVPASYRDYCEALRKCFGTAFEFRSAGYYTELLKRNGFAVLEERRSPRANVGSLLSWAQFFLYLRTGRGSSQRWFLLKYWMLRLLSRTGRAGYEGGQIIIASRDS